MTTQLSWGGPSLTGVLSATYGIGEYRAHAGDRISYRVVGRRRFRCDECFALRHELGVGGRQSYRASIHRLLRGRPDLYLCAGHSELWRQRDNEDMWGRAS